jgi:hypothetical protein
VAVFQTRTQPIEAVANNALSSDRVTNLIGDGCELFPNFYISVGDNN